MGYTVQSITQGLQANGINAGRVATFIRFAERGVRFVSAEELADRAAEWWFGEKANRMVVLTGGVHQADVDLIDRLHGWHFYIAAETNGTKPVPLGIDWVTITPPPNADIRRVWRCDELKVPYPVDGAHPATYDHIPAEHRWIVPAADRETAAKFCLQNPRWRLSGAV